MYYKLEKHTSLVLITLVAFPVYFGISSSQIKVKSTNVKNNLSIQNRAHSKSRLCPPTGVPPDL